MFIKLKLLLRFFLNEIYKFKSKLIFLINFFREISILKLVIFFSQKILFHSGIQI